MAIGRVAHGSLINTFMIMGHNLNIIRLADWVIDIGPEGGKGGELIFEGLPEDLVRCEQSVTGKYLKKVI